MRRKPTDRRRDNRFAINFGRIDIRRYERGDHGIW